MNSFSDKCCNECWHSIDNPCNLFIGCCTEGPLCHHHHQCEDEIKNLNKKLLNIEHDLPIIFIGMGTCGLASGAAKVEEAIREELEKLEIKAVIQPTGCIGYCAVEVLVDVKLPGEDRISYCEITPKVVPKLIQKTLVDKEVFKEKLLGTFGQGKEDLPNINEIPFFKTQQKIVLENCGVISPLSIDEYIASGGFKALDKVLRHMKPDEVVKEILNSGLRGRAAPVSRLGKNGNLLISSSPNKNTLSAMPMKGIRARLWTVQCLKAILSELLKECRLQHTLSAHRSVIFTAVQSTRLQ